MTKKSKTRAAAVQRASSDIPQAQAASQAITEGAGSRSATSEPTADAVGAAPLPMVSVLLPTYNHAPYVVETVDSVLGQSGCSLELLIIDDASSDDTWEVLQRYRDDPRVRMQRHEHNQGAHHTLNELLAWARAPRIAILNSDDVYLPGRLEACLRVLDEGADLVGTDIQLIDGNSAALTEHWWVEAFAQLKAVRAEGDWGAALLAGNVFMTTSNVVFDRRVLDHVQGFRDFRYVLDYDFLLRAWIAGARFAWIDAPLLKYRLHESNTISDSPLRANQECLALLRELAPEVLRDSGGAYPQRWQALNEQMARCERYIVEILLAQRHHALVEQERNWRADVEARDRWVAERDQWIAERDQMIVDRNQWIADRDRWIAERDDWIAERDRALAERTELLAQYQRRFDPLLRFIGWRGARVLAGGLTALLSVPQRVRGLTGRASRWLMLERQFAHPPMRITSFAALREWLAPHFAHGVRCVSFDVFDTLLSRCIEPPEWLHRRVAEVVAQQLGGEWTAEQVLAARHAEEQALRQATHAAGGDHECHYDPLVEGWVRRLLGHDDEHFVARIHAIERRFERLALIAKPDAVALLEWLKSQQIRVIAVSDMYLGHDHVRWLLDDCGYAGLVDQVYVSADCGLGKYTGRLHAYVMEREGLGANEIIHVGDNLTSDMAAPTSLGIRGVFLDEAAERKRRRRQHMSANMSGRGGIWPGRMLNEIVAERLRQNGRPVGEDFFYRFGVEVLGPMFAVFTLGLVERLRALQPDKVFFLARDGYFFQQLYDHYRAEVDGDLPASTYLYASRRVLTSAAVADGLTLAQAQVAFYNPAQQGMASLCKTYGLPADDFRAAAEQHGFSDFDAPIHDWNDPRLIAFLADEAVQARIRAHGLEARAMLHDYLAQHGFFGAGRVAFVDIGWNGTIQKFLVEAFGDEPGFPSVHGYYYALGTAMHGAFNHGGSIEGLLMDMRRDNPCERAPSDFEELFEQGARSPEATTLGYRRGADGIEPILKDDSASDRQQELQCNPAVLAMQEGALTYFRHFLAAVELTGFNFAQLRPYALAVAERAVVYPDTVEARELSRLAHTEDFGHDGILQLTGEPVRWRQLRRPRTLYQRLQGLHWRYAPLAGFVAPFGAWCMRALHLHKSSNRN